MKLPAIPLAFTFVVALLWLGACSTTSVVKRGQPFEKEGPVTLVMRDGSARQVPFVKAVGDSLVFSRRLKAPRMPVAQADRLEYINHGLGVVRGLWVGPLVGMGVGALLGSTAVGECDPGGGACIFGGPGGMGFLGFFLGLFVGPAVGGAAGSKITVNFDTAAYVPPGSGGGVHKDGYQPAGTGLR